MKAANYLPEDPDELEKLIEQARENEFERKAALSPPEEEKPTPGEGVGDRECSNVTENESNLYHGEENGKKLSLREQAYAKRFDPSRPHPPDELSMVIGEFPIASRGNVSVVQGKSKVGKSAIFSAVMAAAHRNTQSASGDTICIEWTGDRTKGAIIHLDTEQSLGDWHQQANRAITRSGVEFDERFVSLPLVLFNRQERREILRQTMAFEDKRRGGIDLVVIDGVADLCDSPNDEKEALGLVADLLAMAQIYRCPIFCGLHENPGSDSGKTRGHLGSELNRKAFANLRCDKDSSTGISTLYGNDMRKREIPKEQGFCFGWDDSAGMHVFAGRSAGLRKSKKIDNRRASERAYFEPVFEDNETQGLSPVLSAADVMNRHRDIYGTADVPSQDAIKKRMQRAEKIDVLRKVGRGLWSLCPSGQKGHEQDKPETSQP